MDLPPTIREHLRSYKNPRYPGTRESEPKVDRKLFFLPLVYASFGERAVHAIMKGLSRRIKPTRKDASALIDDWELRNKSCCYNGTVNDLFNLEDTVVYAVSYKHAPRECWSRKGPDRICKFSDLDQELFKNAVEGIGNLPFYRFVMVWCDQVISTRLQSEGTSTPWYLAGLLPYLTFQVLQLSTHFPASELEHRIWIRAERSLGRMACGILDGINAVLGVGPHSGKGQRPSDSMRTLAKMIICGYWPEDLGFWANDYMHMRRWAVGVLCRGEKYLLDLPLFEEQEEVDNMEVLSAIDKFAIIPDGLEDEVPSIFVADQKFFLKATAWNLSLKKHWWNNTPEYVSHYMGYLSESRFSWWQANERKYVYGCFADCSHVAVVLAIESGTGYQVFRGRGDLTLYSHAELIAGLRTQRAIEEITTKAGFRIPDSLEWKLLYSSDDTLLNSKTHPDVVKELGGPIPRADVLLPSPFWGMTTKLYTAAMAKCVQSERRAVARKLVAITDEWNKHIKHWCNDWISVKDTRLGPVWLEGFNDDRISFGYLEFVTVALLLETRSGPANSVMLRAPWNTVCDIRAKMKYMTEDEQEVVKELFGSIDEDSCNENFSHKDIACYTLSGGFSNHFRIESPRLFLTGRAESMGYWSTLVVCVKGKVQVRFRNNQGEERIAQRPTALQEYAGIGFVHPLDANEVTSVSIEYDDWDEERAMLMWWKNMKDTTTREQMCEKFPNSVRMTEGNEKILAVDMTLAGTGRDEKQLVHTQDLVAFRISFDAVKERADGSYSAEYWEDAHKHAEGVKKDRELNIETERLLDEVLNVQRDAAEQGHGLWKNGKGHDEVEKLLREAQR